MWNSEAKVLSALDGLQAPWRVFHSIAWQGRRDGHESDGEADFVLVHPEYGVIVLEVKGGGIELKGGKWFSSNQDGRYPIKNPFAQAKTSKYAMIRALRDLGLGRVPVVHAVAFPDGSALSSFGMEGPRDLILDKADLTQPEGAIQRVVAHWKSRVKPPLSEEDVQQITMLLRPSGKVAPLLRDELAVASQALIKLTERQLDVLSISRRVPRLVVLGGAGTGKTVLARERATRLASSGVRTLFLCYNAPLAEHLRRVTGDVPGLTIGTFHSFCLSTLRAAGVQIPAHPNQQWWDADAANELANAASSFECPRYEALVVDEGQDFSPDWLDALMLLLREPDEDAIICFADHHQVLYPRGFRVPKGWPELTLDLNCRNTHEIAQRVAAIFGETLVCQGAVGRSPVFHLSQETPEQLRVAQRMVARMLQEEGLLPNQIVVLCDLRSSVEWLRERMAGDIPFVSLGERGVVAETIQRFKGLEADVVICVFSNMEEASAALLPLAYVGMSRARVMLVVVGSKVVRRFISWSSPLSVRT